MSSASYIHAEISAVNNWLWIAGLWTSWPPRALTCTRTFKQAPWIGSSHYEYPKINCTTT
ncbi:hypothetical protein B0T18DRAFT_412766, partial [Schizothecium vesticola]